MTSATRVPQAEITGIVGAMVKRYSKKTLGEVSEPLGVMWHDRRVLKPYFGSSGQAEKKWDAGDRRLKSFAHMATGVDGGLQLLPRHRLSPGSPQGTRLGPGYASCHGGASRTCSPHWSATCWRTLRR